MRGGMRGTGGMGASTTTVQKYNVGTLVLDMWDVEDHQLVWRGIASSNLSTDPKKNAKKIDQAALKLWYLSIIASLAGDTEVRTATISGHDWCEIDYPLDLQRARQMVAGWRGAESDSLEQIS